MHRHPIADTGVYELGSLIEKIPRLSISHSDGFGVHALYLIPFSFSFPGSAGGAGCLFIIQTCRSLHCSRLSLRALLPSFTYLYGGASSPLYRCSFLTLLAPLATQALQINTPANLTAGNHTIAFTIEDSDPAGSSLNFYLVNNATNELIAPDVAPNAGSVTVAIPANISGCAISSPSHDPFSPHVGMDGA